MEDEMVGRLIDLANRDYNRLTVELSDGKTFNTGHMASYVGILFKVAFANMEKAIGLEATRESFKCVVDYMMDVMIDGAYDKENDRIK